MATRETTVKLTVADNFTTQMRAFMTALDQSDKALHKTGSQLNIFDNANKQLAGAIKGGATMALASLPALAIGAGAAMAKMGMDMQQTRVAFTTLTGSAELANKHLEDLRAFAKTTPFQFNELTDASKKMQAFGFSTEKVIPMMTDIGDAVSALGAGGAGIDSVVRALGQMQMKGKVSAEEMNQLAEIGINAWTYLAEGVGKSTSETMKMTEKGLYPANDAIQAILKGMREDFGGGMAAQSKTAAGQLSNLTDAITEIGTTIGESLVPALGGAIEKLVEFAGTIKQGIETASLLISWQDKLGDAVKGVNDTMIVSAKSYEEYRDSVLGAAVAAGKMSDAEAEAVRTGRMTETGMWALQKVTGLVSRELYDNEKATKQAEAANKQFNETRDESTRNWGRETQAIDENTLSVKEQEAARKNMAKSMIGTRELAMAYTEDTKELAEMQKKLADLDNEIAKNGPVRVATMQNEKMSTEERAVAELKLTQAIENAADVKRKEGDSDADYALRVAQANEKVGELTQSLGTHTGALGGATKAQKEQREELEKGIEAFKKASEVERATAIFQSLGQALEEGKIGPEQYAARMDALNKVTGFYTDASLKAAIAQGQLLATFTDPSSEAWRLSLQKNRDELDGLTEAERAAAESSPDVFRQRIADADKYRDALDKVPRKVETEVVTKYKTETIAAVGDTAEARDKRTEKREEDAAARAAKDAGNVTQSVTTSLQKANEGVTSFASKSKDQVKGVTDTTQTAFTKMAETITSKFGLTSKSVADAFAVMTQSANTQIATINTAIETYLPTYRELIYKIVVRGEPPEGQTTPRIPGHGAQHGANIVVPDNPRGGMQDYYPVIAAPGERIVVQTVAQQQQQRGAATKSGGDTYTYNTTINDKLAATMWLDKLRRERIARSEARMGV